jgi:hypothetical protein
MFSGEERARTLARLRRICLALPETSERLSHGAPTFFVRGKRAFLMVLTNHHGDGLFAIWCAAPEALQRMLVEADPERFFVSSKMPMPRSLLRSSARRRGSPTDETGRSGDRLLSRSASKARWPDGTRRAGR